MRPFVRPLKKTTRAHPLVQRFIELMNYEQITPLDVAERSGVNEHTIRNWRNRANPQIQNFDACLNVLGYELAIRRKRD